MIKRLVYIVLLLIFVSGLSSAKTKNSLYIFATGHAMRSVLLIQSKDTINTKKHQQEEDKKKIKEILKAKRQAKPEKIDEGDNVKDQKAKPKRERRPEGMERPPENTKKKWQLTCKLIADIK